jgi:hypothetical protein
MERITATFDAATVAAIRRVAGKRGVSAFLQEAARERLARLEVLELLDELDEKHGAPSPAVMAEVDREAERVFGPLKLSRASARPAKLGQRRRRA